MIPQKIEDAILSEYQDVEPVKQSLDYLRHHRLNQLIDSIEIFHYDRKEDNMRPKGP